MNKVKTLFIGAGNFAVEILHALQKSPFIEIVGVITQPDKPAGRKKVLTPCAVKAYLNQLNEIEKQSWKIWQPEKIKLASQEILAESQPELIIAADYGQILPKDLIDYPKRKCLNVHGSLLPDLRGAVPTPMAILKGYQETGVSIPVMTHGLDDGPVLARRKVQILSDDTTATLRPRLARVGGELLIEILPQWLSGQITPQQQDESKATFTWQKDIDKEKAQILPEHTIQEVERMVRAFFPWPVAWGIFTRGNKQVRVKILAVELLNEQDTELLALGFGLHYYKKNLYLNLRDGAVLVNKLQIEGKGIVEGKECGWRR